MIHTHIHPTPLYTSFPEIQSITSKYLQSSKNVSLKRTPLLARVQQLIQPPYHTQHVMLAQGFFHEMGSSGKRLIKNDILL